MMFYIHCIQFLKDTFTEVTYFRCRSLYLQSTCFRSLRSSNTRIVVWSVILSVVSNSRLWRFDWMWIAWQIMRMVMIHALQETLACRCIGLCSSWSFNHSLSFRLFFLINFSNALIYSVAIYISRMFNPSIKQILGYKMVKLKLTTK